MRKLMILGLAALIAAGPVGAGPINWAKHHKRFLLAAGSLAGASVVQYKGTSYCQRGDVERCIEGYGSRRTFNYFSMGMGVAMLSASEDCWKHDGGKVCYGLAYWVPATQVGLGVKDFTSYTPEGKNLRVKPPEPCLRLPCRRF